MYKLLYLGGRDQKEEEVSEIKEEEVSECGEYERVQDALGAALTSFVHPPNLELNEPMISPNIKIEFMSQWKNLVSLHFMVFINKEEDYGDEYVITDMKERDEFADLCGIMERKALNGGSV